MVVGLGVEAYTYEVNPTFFRERYREAHDLIVEAWTRPGPFHFEGKHYDFRFVNVWPRPLQEPHPPIWIPGSGSLETIRWVAERRYPFIALPFSPYQVMQEHYELLREHAARSSATRCRPSSSAGRSSSTSPRPTSRRGPSSSPTSGISPRRGSACRASSCSRRATHRSSR